VRVGFFSSYRGSADDAPILRVVGERGAAFFKQSFGLKTKGDLIPESAPEGIIGELQEIFARHRAGAALSANAVFKPNKEFDAARHTLFTAEQNLEIVNVVPVSASVKTKLGRGGVTRIERGRRSERANPQGLVRLFARCGAYFTSSCEG